MANNLALSGLALILANSFEWGFDGTALRPDLKPDFQCRAAHLI